MFRIRVIVVGTRVQTLDKAVCISIYANALGKGMNPPVSSPLPPPALGKLWARWVL